jgi:hypothetical protein
VKGRGGYPGLGGDKPTHTVAGQRRTSADSVHAGTGFPLATRASGLVATPAELIDRLEYSHEAASSSNGFRHFSPDRFRRAPCVTAVLLALTPLSGM